MLMNNRDGGRTAVKVEKMDDRTLLNYVVHQLSSTLLSNTERGRNGYSCVKKLEQDFEFDTGLYADGVAERFGFSSFEVFVKSTQMEKHIEISLLPDDVIFFGAKLQSQWDKDRLAPLLGDMQISAETVSYKKERSEREKFARAMLPENRGKVLEGRKLMAELVYMCGGEHTEVSYQQVRDAYTRKYGGELSKNVIKEYFQRDKLKRVIQDYCHNELELLMSADHALAYFKLKKPYGEIVESFTNLQEQQQKPPPPTSYNGNAPRRPIRRPRETFEETLRLNIAPVLPHINPELFASDIDFNAETVFGPSSPSQANQAELPSKASKFTFRDTDKPPDRTTRPLESNANVTIPPESSSNSSSRVEDVSYSLMSTLREDLHEEPPVLPPNSFSMRKKQKEVPTVKRPQIKQDLNRTVSTLEEESDSEEEDLGDKLVGKRPAGNQEEKPHLSSASNNLEHQQQGSSSSKQSILLDFWKDDDDDEEEQPEQTNQPSSSHYSADIPAQTKPPSNGVTGAATARPTAASAEEALFRSRSMSIASTVLSASRPDSVLTLHSNYCRSTVADEWKIREMTNLIVKIVLYRGSHTTKIEYLLQVLNIIDPEFEAVFQDQSIIEFIKQNCKSLHILYHEDEPVVCSLS